MITTAPTITTPRKRNASASLRSGFRISAPPGDVAKLVGREHQATQGRSEPFVGLPYGRDRGRSSAPRDRVPEAWRTSPGGALQDVDGHVDDDPHHVDEVPVDPADLDAVVVVGREVPAERTDRHEQQDREADEHVRAVQSREAVEDRRERAVL